MDEQFVLLEVSRPPSGQFNVVLQHLSQFMMRHIDFTMGVGNIRYNVYINLDRIHTHEDEARQEAIRQGERLIPALGRNSSTD